MAERFVQIRKTYGPEANATVLGCAHKEMTYYATFLFSHVVGTPNVLDINRQCNIPSLIAGNTKVSFLKDMIRKVDFKGIEAYKGRTEKRADLPALFHSYDIVTTSALAPPGETISLCSPYLELGSILVTYKGSRVHQEIENSERLMEELSFRINKKVSYSLPEAQAKRYLLILKKEIN